MQKCWNTEALASKELRVPWERSDGAQGTTSIQEKVSVITSGRRDRWRVRWERIRHMW